MKWAQNATVTLVHQKLLNTIRQTHQNYFETGEILRSCRPAWPNGLEISIAVIQVAKENKIFNHPNLTNS